MDLIEALDIADQYRGNICKPPEDKFMQALNVMIEYIRRDCSLHILPKHFISADAETSKSVDNYIESISTPTGVNIFDILDKNKE